MTFYPNDLELSWDYGEAHHFKGPHDGIGGTVKSKVYQDVTASKVIIRDAKHFLEIQVEYLDILKLYTLQIHHLEFVGKSKVNFYYNSTYKKSSNSDLEALNKPSENKKDEPFTEAVDQHDALEVTIGNIVVVFYELRKKQLKYLGVDQNIASDCVSVQFLKRIGEKTFC